MGNVVPASAIPHHKHVLMTDITLENIQKLLETHPNDIKKEIKHNINDFKVSLKNTNDKIKVVKIEFVSFLRKLDIFKDKEKFSPK